MSIKKYKRELTTIRQQCFQPELVCKDSFRAIHLFVKMTDQLLVEIFDELLHNTNESVALVAIGGYGRNELCPFSDLDCLILHNGDHNTESIARLVRALWDCGFPLGCVVRNIAECKKILGEDLASDTALLDARYLAGSKQLFRQLVTQVIEPFFKRRQLWFVHEMNTALKDGIYASDLSLYTVEPHLKNGICTLRDCQRMVWGTRVSEKMFTGHEQHLLVNFDHRSKQKFTNAYHNLLQFRCALHMVSERRLDILEFSQQQSVAQFLGFGSDNAGLLMEKYFETVSGIKQLVLIYLERQNVRHPLINGIRWHLSAISIGKRIKLLDGILAHCGSIPPSDSNPISWVLDVYLMAIHYQAFPGTVLQNRLRMISESNVGQGALASDVNSKFIELISVNAPIGRVLRSMYETSVLEVILPEMRSIKCKVEYDSYHEFTVDQHTICAVSLIDELEKDSDSQIQEIVKSLNGLFTIRMAALLHDIGKSLEGNHAYTGAVIATNICDRFGIEENQRNTVVFLIRHHLELSLLAFQREPEEQTIVTFAEKIKTSAILDLLYLLTIVDIRSVGRKTWTEWKGVQLKSIYERVKKHLTNHESTNKKLVNNYDESKFELRNYEHLFDLIDQKKIQIHGEVFTGFERLIVAGIDRPHFFADIVGCLSSEGYNILSAQISTSTKGNVLDVFHVEPDSLIKIPSAQHIQNLIRKWEKIINGISTTDNLIEERLRLYPPKPQRISSERDSEIHIDNNISRDFTVIELRTPDRYGLLYTVAQGLSNCGVNIISAKLSTRVSKAIDVFYVVGADGKKIIDEQFQDKIRTIMLGLLSKNSL